MARTSTFGYTNTDTNEATMNSYALNVPSNYALLEDEPNQVIIDNKTAPLDQQELITYMAKPVNSVNTRATIQHPSGIKGGIQYVVKVEEVLSTVSTEDENFRVDEPITAYLTVRHPKSGNITSSTITTVVERLLSACRTDSGDWRWDDLMRSAIKPTE